MIRVLLTTTALAALLSTGAMAQTAPATPAAPAAPMTPAAPAPAAPEAPAAAPAAPMAPAAPAAPMTPAAPADAAAPAGAMANDDAMGFDLSAGYTAMDDDSRASEIIGATIYSSAADDAETVGNVNDLIVGNDGQIEAVIVGVGGFLGIGEKTVAVSFDNLEWTVATDNTERWVLPTTREALEAAPDFVWVEDDAMAPAGNAMAPAGNAMTPAPVDTMTPAPVVTDNAAAPDQEAMPTALDRSTLTEFDETTLTADELEGTTVYGINDENIGTISDFVLNEGGEIDAVIVDVGGFLGLGAKPVAIGFENLNFSIDANNNRYLFLNTTQEQLEAQPEFNTDTYTTERDTQRMVVTP